jgi:hypothetical protein
MSGLAHAKKERCCASQQKLAAEFGSFGSTRRFEYAPAMSALPPIAAEMGEQLNPPRRAMAQNRCAITRRQKVAGVVACPPLKHVRSNQNDAAIDHPERLRP